eukprot:3659909-Pleurochrysis_carterae.AAC.1
MHTHTSARDTRAGEHTWTRTLENAQECARTQHMHTCTCEHLHMNALAHWLIPFLPFPAVHGEHTNAAVLPERCGEGVG